MNEPGIFIYCRRCERKRFHAKTNRRFDEPVISRTGHGNEFWSKYEVQCSHCQTKRLIAKRAFLRIINLVRRAKENYRFCPCCGKEMQAESLGHIYSECLTCPDCGHSEVV